MSNISYVNPGRSLLNYTPDEGFNTPQFIEVFEDVDTFINEIKETNLNVMSDDNLKIIFSLLFANYGTSNITTINTMQWKYQLFSTIYMYGPTWAKKREIQDAINSLDISSDDIFKGTKVIYNSSENPSTAPSTDTLEELTTIDNQNTTNYKYSKIDAYSRLYNIVENDVTKQFMDKFKKLFIQVVGRSRTTYIGTGE